MAVSYYGAARQPLDDLRPLGAELLDADGDELVLLRGPLALLDLGAQVVEPPLSALLAHAPFEVRGDERPGQG